MEIDCPLFDGVIPLAFRGDDGNADVFASGVVIRTFGHLYLLSAAHVLDDVAHGEVIFPGPETFRPITGDPWVTIAPGGDREKDDADFGFQHLGTVAAERLDARVHPIEEWQIEGGPSLSDVPLFYVFVGFPWRRSITRGFAIESDRLMVSGSALTHAEMRKRRLDPSRHIAINFDRKRSSFGHRSGIAPSPQGMSGGGVFVWRNPRPGEAPRPKELTLAGIAHTYDKQLAMLVGTRIEGIVGEIAKHLPGNGTIQISTA